MVWLVAVFIQDEHSVEERYSTVLTSIVTYRKRNLNNNTTTGSKYFSVRSSSERV